MSEQPTTAEATPSPSGRAADGKFAPGNQFGPGNPFARKCAAFRAALMEAVTEQDIKDIAVKLRDDAKAGDKAAVKLLFQYVIGKPQPAVDPDTLDLQEMRAYLAGAVPPEVVEEMQRGLPLAMLLKIWPFFLFAKEQTNLQGAADRHGACEQRRQERAQRKAERRRQRQEARQQATSPQPEADAAAAEPDAPPSPNGHFRENGFASAEQAPSANPAMWVANATERDGVSPASPGGDFLREQREEMVIGHGVGLGWWALSPSRQRGT
jgi:hypothetical protein